MTAEEAEEAIAERIPKDTLGSNPSMFKSLAENIHKASQVLERSGAFYAGTCVRTYDGELSLGTLLVTVTPFEFGDTTVAANGIIRSLVAERGESWAGSVFDTPNGPIAVVSGMKSFQIPVETSPSSEELELPMAEMQAFLPVPQGVENQQQCLVCINFTTPGRVHWDEYCSDIVELLCSITFDCPDRAAPSASSQSTSESLPALPPTEPTPGDTRLDNETSATPFG
ncbi:hypothetical protein ACFVT2_21565 [Streptomyces sp. NPDC058000]|uniref:hypothetical protein n=1 Tax=Streptomyces sp. NPDC058000 TaxID=3346299 RepID=UPI0036EBA396